MSNQINNQKYFDMLRKIKDISFATVDSDGNPKIRIIDVMFTENEKLYFLTARGKEFHKEITEQGKVAVVGMNKAWQMIRLEGKVQKESQELLGRIFDENPSMNGVYPGESRNILDVFSIYQGNGEFFDLGQEPINRIAFTFGNGESNIKGFHITDECIGCGSCKDKCPQGAIEEGTPYVIEQEHCLHCGLCAEVCPVGAAVNQKL